MTIIWQHTKKYFGTAQSQEHAPLTVVRAGLLGDRTALRVTVC